MLKLGKQKHKAASMSGIAGVDAGFQAVVSGLSSAEDQTPLHTQYTEPHP